MSEFKIEVVQIGDVEKHSGADTLSITHVHGGYPVIFRTGDFQPGDLAVYIPVDSVVPSDDARWAFLDGRCRIKAKRLRGIFSMGLLTKSDSSWTVGQDVREALRIVKYEPPEPMTMGGENEPDPGFLPIFTDIEALRRWPDILQTGEEVFITEKIHGCVVSKTKISMADGTKKPIDCVVAGDLVLGVDMNNCVTPTKVVTKYSNGKAGTWLSVIGSRSGAGRGNSFFRIFCTPEHQFWSPSLNAYKKAESLVGGDQVSLLRSDIGLTPIQEQILLGKMLGDGSYAETDYTAHVAWSHCLQDSDYLEWTCCGVGELDSHTRENIRSGYGSDMVRTRTVNNVWIREKFGDFFAADDGIKRVPLWVGDALTPLAIAFWYMDDGSLGHHDDQQDRANFAVCAFSEEDCSILVKALARFGIGAVYYCSGGYSRLRLNADNAERLFLLVAPYIPPCMQRKLPERYRGHAGWLPKQDSVYKPTLVTQKIISVTTANNINSDRYDLETDTNNYFANGVLVHNSNARFLYRDGRLWVGSHTQIKKLNVDKPVVWWQAALKYELEDKLKAMAGFAFYGEVYGFVQDLRYGATPQNKVMLRIFDVLDTTTRRYMDAVDFYSYYAPKAGLPVVPVLYHGPWQGAQGLAEGKTLIDGADHVREGVVIRPAHERFDDRLGGRVILKIHGEGFLLRQEK